MADRALVLLAGAVVVAFVGGCSQGRAGTPVGPPGTTSSTAAIPPVTSTASTSRSTPVNTYGAPRVANPLDATTFLAKPCAVLTPAQMRTLDLPKPGEPDTDSAVAQAAGPSCLWFGRKAATGVGVGFLSGNKNGLADTYRGHATGAFDGYWEPTSVDGYPAVFNGPEPDSRGTGNCDITVGISDTLTFRVGEQGSTGSNACGRAKQVASMVIQTLRAGG